MVGRDNSRAGLRSHSFCCVLWDIYCPALLCPSVTFSRAHHCHSFSSSQVFRGSEQVAYNVHAPSPQPVSFPNNNDDNDKDNMYGLVCSPKGREDNGLCIIASAMCSPL